MMIPLSNDNNKKNKKYCAVNYPTENILNSMFPKYIIIIRINLMRTVHIQYNNNNNIHSGRLTSNNCLNL